MDKMVKNKNKQPEFASMGIMDCKECKTQEDWADKNREFRKSRGMLEW